MVGLSDQISLTRAALVANITEFARRTGRAPHRIKQETGLSGTLLAFVNPDATSPRPPTIDTLRRLESHYRADKAWPGSGSDRWRSSCGQDGMITQFVYGDKVGDRFTDLVSRWREARVTDVDPLTFCDIEGVSVIDVANRSPEGFKLIRHSVVARRVGAGIDQEGLRIDAMARPDYYRTAYLDDLSRTKYCDRLDFSEGFWASLPDERVAYFFRLLLPLGDFVLSCIDVTNISTMRDVALGSFNRRLEGAPEPGQA